MTSTTNSLKALLITSLLLTCVFCISNIGYGQQKSNELLQVKIAPLALFDPVTAVFQFGVQKNISRRTGIFVEHGLRFRALSPFHYMSERKDYRYSKSTLTIKYYPRSGEDSYGTATRTYCAVQGFYFPQRYRKDNGWILKADQAFHYNYSNITRKVTAASLILGIELGQNKFKLDAFIGAGIRRLTIMHQTSGEVVGFRSEPVDFHINPVDEREGTYYRLNLIAGFKIGYPIYK